jgi:predicted DNA-binding protein YlxM (UPF0122 family)
VTSDGPSYLGSGTFRAESWCDYLRYYWVRNSLTFIPRSILPKERLNAEQNLLNLYCYYILTSEHCKTSNLYKNTIYTHAITSEHNFSSSAIYQTICCTRTKFYTFSKEKGRVASIGSIPIQIKTSKQQSKDEYF